MSEQRTAPPPRHSQGDELIGAIKANTAALVALATAVGVLIASVRSNTAELERLADGEDDEDEDVCPDCDDPDCDGDCEDEPPKAQRRRRR